MNISSPVTKRETLLHRRRGTSSYRSALRSALVLATLILCVEVTWPFEAAAFNQEGGLIETISAVGLFAAGLVALVRYPGVNRMYVGLVCLLLAERELEASIYVDGNAPFALLAGLDSLLDLTIVQVLLLVLVVGGVIWHGIPRGWRALRLRAPFLMVFMVAGAIAVIAQVLEEVAGLYSAELSEVMAMRAFVLEETFEMFFSIGVLSSVLIGWPNPEIKGIVHTQDRVPSG